MANALVIVAATLLLITAAVHSVLGERRLIAPLLTMHDGILKIELTRFLLRFVWHGLSICFTLIALILLVIVFFNPAAVRVWVIGTTGLVFVGVGIWDMLGSRLKHVGWPLLLAIGAVALASFLF